MGTVVFDSILASAYAFHNYISDGYNLSKPVLHQNVCANNSIVPWSDGSKLMQYLSNVSFCLVFFYHATFMLILSYQLDAEWRDSIVISFHIIFYTSVAFRFHFSMSN